MTSEEHHQLAGRLIKIERQLIEQDSQNKAIIFLINQVIKQQSNANKTQHIIKGRMSQELRRTRERAVRAETKLSLRDEVSSLLKDYLGTADVTPHKWTADAAKKTAVEISHAYNKPK